MTKIDECVEKVWLRNMLDRLETGYPMPPTHNLRLCLEYEGHESIMPMACKFKCIDVGSNYFRESIATVLYTIHGTPDSERFDGI